MEKKSYCVKLVTCFIFDNLTHMDISHHINAWLAHTNLSICKMTSHSPTCSQITGQPCFIINQTYRNNNLTSRCISSWQEATTKPDLIQSITNIQNIFGSCFATCLDGFPPFVKAYITGIRLWLNLQSSRKLLKKALSKTSVLQSFVRLFYCASPCLL